MRHLRNVTASRDRTSGPKIASVGALLLGIAAHQMAFGSGVIGPGTVVGGVVLPGQRLPAGLQHLAAGGTTSGVLLPEGVALAWGDDTSGQARPPDPRLGRIRPRNELRRRT